MLCFQMLEPVNPTGSTVSLLCHGTFLLLQQCHHPPAGGSPADFRVVEGQERGTSGLQAPADAAAPAWGGQQPGRLAAPAAGDRPAAGSRSGSGAAVMVPTTGSAVPSDVAGTSGRAAAAGASPGAVADGIGAGIGVSSGGMQSMSGSDAWGSGIGSRGAAPAGSSGGARAGAGCGAGAGAGAGAGSDAGQCSTALGTVAVAEDGLGPAALRRVRLHAQQTCSCPAGLAPWLPLHALKAALWHQSQSSVMRGVGSQVQEQRVLPQQGLSAQAMHEVQLVPEAHKDSMPCRLPTALPWVRALALPRLSSRGLPGRRQGPPCLSSPTLAHPCGTWSTTCMEGTWGTRWMTPMCMT